MAQADRNEWEKRLKERERKLNERERGLNEERAKLNILNGKFSIKALELKDRTELIEQKESEYEKKLKQLEERMASLNKKEAEAESSFSAREISLQEREKGILKQEQEQELELKKKGLELKAVQEAELARERVQAMESVKGQLEQQRIEFEAALARYEKELKKQREEEAASYQKRKAELKEQLSRLEKEFSDQKEAQEAELAGKKAEATRSLEEHLAEQRAEFEAMLTQYEKERKQEAENQAEKMRQDARAEAEKLRFEAEKIRQEAKKIESTASAQAEKIWNDAQEGSERLRDRAQEKAAAAELELKKKKEELKERESGLLEREVFIKEQEDELERKKTRLELDLKKKRLELEAAQEEEFAKQKSKAMDELSDLLSKRRKEAEAALSRFEEEEKQAAGERAAKITTEAKAEAAKELEAAKEARERAAKLEEECKEREKELDAREEELTLKEDELSEAQKITEHKMTENAANFQAQLEAKEQALKELRDNVKYLMEGQAAVEKFKASIGQEPAVIENEIHSLQTTARELKEELSKRAPAHVQKERDDLKKECESQREQISQLEKENRILVRKNGELAAFETINMGLESRNDELASLVGELRSQNDTYKMRLERLCSKESRFADREQRLAQINKGILLPLIGAGQPMELSEISWLENIYKQCDKFGIHFPKRILYAFHTALKIADWSTVTVLAGVSGTGKSELPKLYAAFGGFNFINVPVQPSWDSQESMLGFFNSIDNRFEPEPLLRFLVQCTEDIDYSKYMSIVLLDEMNLAHVEHYFADFLSKLETRRGTSNRAVPTVEVKLGAGVEPYLLRLERSILWTGTMNQDETTKSLSDKVLDRGLVIHFPRPSKLRSRNAMGVLDRAVRETNRPMLSKRKWEKWIVREAALQKDQEKEFSMYRSFVEEINAEMEYTGRALGHRVWQAIEYYMLNYPSVSQEMQKLSPGEMTPELRESMKTAFEDQIVQKIMPKLRGVETRGRSKEHLDKIEAMLEDKGFERLKDDFEIACEQGYGQFIWNSAKYIEADEAQKTDAEPEMGSGEKPESEWKN